MSRRNELAVLAVLAGIAVSGPAAAEIAPRSEARKTKPTAVESMARVVDDTPRTVLRCWQEGRLVFEGTNLQMAGGDTAGTVPALKGPDGRTVQLLDLRQGLCVYERSKGGT